jgi:hypothetical protein
MLKWLCMRSLKEHWAQSSEWQFFNRTVITQGSRELYNAPRSYIGSVTHNKRIELRETEIDVLIRRGLLKADARNDVFAVRDALHRHFEATLKA